ncbi:hypothetical protein SLA2020_236670 [Shorea laevis]
MSKTSFLNMKYGFSKKSSSKKLPTQLSFSKERQKSTVSSKGLVPNTEEMKFVFDKFDTNRDGRMSKEEYKAAVRILGKGTSDAEMLQAFKAIDADGDGFIDFQEFTEMMRNTGDEGNVTSEIQSAFRMYDLDGNGKISAEELMDVMKKMGERCSLETCRRMIRGVDANGDGLIDMDEFVTMMTRTMKLA